MQEWELLCMVVNLYKKLILPGTSDIWEVKDNYGKSDFDRLQEFATQGFELVSVTPIIKDGTTTELLYTFKRPLNHNNEEE